MVYFGWMKNIEKGLNHNFRVSTVKYLSEHRKKRSELVDEPKKQPSRIFLHKELATKLIIDCRKTAPRKFRTRLGSKPYHAILTKEQISANKNKKFIWRRKLAATTNVF